MDYEKLLKNKLSHTNLEFVEPYVKSIESEAWKIELGVAIDNQRLVNEKVGESDDFADFSVAAATYCLTHAVTPMLVSYQTLLGPNGVICYQSGDKTDEESVSARTRFWKTRIFQNEVLDPEVFGQSLADEMDREILYDLINNAGQRLIWDISAVDGDTLRQKCSDLVAVVKKTRQVIKAKSKREEANWLVTSPTGCNLLEMGGMVTDVQDWSKVKTICPVGNMLDMRIFCEPRFPTTTFLLGYRGIHPCDAGYFYCPYLMLTQAPESKEDGRRLIFRYAKKLMPSGSNYYAKIEIENF